MLWQVLQRIREEAPLVHNITNYVVMNLTANALLAIGASPVMAHASEEVDEMVAISRSLVLNMGTLDPSWVDSMLKAGSAAKRLGVPVVFDPVGSGATTFRTSVALQIMEQVRPQIVRGNASEIRSLVQRDSSTKGVDSAHGPEAALEAARWLSQTFGSVVSVSGPVDIVVDHDQIVEIHSGHPIMTRVTGMGCTATAVTGAFAAVSESPLEAAIGAMGIMGIAGEIAATRAAGPGSFVPLFLDTLAALDEGQMTQARLVRRN